jgi:type I restriction enzyme R subunit
MGEFGKFPDFLVSTLEAEINVWQQESYDHWMRDANELERIINYVEYNPVKAGLISDARLWPFGSATHRQALGLPFGTPLPRLVG